MPFVFNPGVDDRIAVVVEVSYTPSEQNYNWSAATSAFKLDMEYDQHPSIYSSTYPMPNPEIDAEAFREAASIVCNTYGLSPKVVNQWLLYYKDFDFSIGVEHPSSQGAAPWGAFGQLHSIRAGSTGGVPSSETLIFDKNRAALPDAGTWTNQFVGSNGLYPSGLAGEKMNISVFGLGPEPNLTQFRYNWGCEMVGPVMNDRPFVQGLDEINEPTQDTKYLFLFDPWYLKQPIENSTVPRKQALMHPSYSKVVAAEVGGVYPIDTDGYDKHVETIKELDYLTFPVPTLWNEGGITFDNFSDQVQILAAVLEEYHEEHVAMKKKQFAGPNQKVTPNYSYDTTRSLEYDILALDKDADKLLEFLNALSDVCYKNGITPTTDKIEFGFAYGDEDSALEYDGEQNWKSSGIKLVYIKKMVPEWEKLEVEYRKLTKEVKEITPQIAALDAKISAGEIPAGAENPVFKKLQERLTQVELRRFEIESKRAAWLEGYHPAGSSKAEQIASDKILYAWKGFDELLGEYVQDERLMNYLYWSTKSGADSPTPGILELPGAMGAFDRICSGEAPPDGDERVTLKEFVQGRPSDGTKPPIGPYVFPRPELVDKPTNSEKEIAERVIARARRTPRPKSISEKLSDSLYVKGSVVKSVVAQRNRNFSDQIGDMTFRLLPHTSVHRIRWDSTDHAMSDLFHYVLNRVDIPTIAKELMECLGLGMSLDDVIEALCDGFLKTIGQDPKLIDEFFTKARSYNLTFATFGADTVIRSGPLKGSDVNLTLISGGDVIQQIQNKMAVKLAQGVDDPFFAAVTETGVQNARGKKLICEFIMAAMFNLDDLIEYLRSSEKDNDPYDIALKRPIVKRCDVTFSFPDSLPILANRLNGVIRKIETLTYTLANKLIVNASRKAIEGIIEACEDKKAPYGQLPLESLLQDTNIDDFNSQFKGLTEDPESWLSGLLAILTASEFCQLVNGAASPILLLEVKKYMQINYPNSAQILATDTQIHGFFRSLGQVLNLDACNLDFPVDTISLDNLCKDGETPRQAALRQRLRALGLTDEQIDAQIEIDKAVKKDLISDMAQNLALGQTAQAQADAELNINDIIAQSDTMQQINKVVINSIFDPIGSAFIPDVSTFIPAVFNEIKSLEAAGYQFKEFPFKTLLGESYKYFEMNFLGGHTFNVYIPSTKFTPAEINIITQQVIPNTGTIDFIGGPGTNKKSDFRLQYKTLPGAPIGKEKYSFEIYDGNPDTNQENTIYVSLKSSNPGVDIKEELLPYVSGDIVETQSQYPVSAFTEFTRDVLSELRDSDFQLGQGEYLDESSDALYDMMFESISERISDIIYSSELFDLRILRSVERPIREEGKNFLGIKELKNMVNRKIQENMANTDFSGAEGEPSALGDAIFEGAVKTLIKIYVVKTILKSIFVFSKFRTEDAFYDSLILPFIVRQISLEEPETAEIMSKFKEFLNNKRENLENRLTSLGYSSKPPREPMTFQEVQDELKKAGLPYRETASGPFKQTADDIIEKCVSDVLTGMKENMESMLRLQLPAIEDEILKDEGEEAAEPHPAPSIDTITALASDVSAPLWLDDMAQANINADSDTAAHEMAQSGGRPDSARTTLLRQQLGTGYNVSGEASWSADNVQFVELPIGASVPPGTNWDPGIAAWVPHDIDGNQFKGWQIHDTDDNVSYFTKNPILWLGDNNDTPTQWAFDFNTESGKTGGFTYKKVFDHIVDSYKKNIIPFNYGALWPTLEDFKDLLPQPTVWPPPNAPTEVEVPTLDGGIEVETFNYEFFVSNTGDQSSLAWAGVDLQSYAALHGGFPKTIAPGGSPYYDWIGNEELALPSQITDGFEVVIKPQLYDYPGIADEVMPEIRIVFDKVEISNSNALSDNTNTAFTNTTGAPDEMELPGDGTHSCTYIGDDFKPTQNGTIWKVRWIANGTYRSRKPKTKDDWSAYADTTLQNLYMETGDPILTFAGQDATITKEQFGLDKDKFEYWKQFASNPATTTDGAPLPLIQIRPPFFQQEGYRVPSVTHFKIDVNGTNFNTDEGGLKAFLTPIDHFGPTYEFEVEGVTSTKATLKMPISVGAAGLVWKGGYILEKQDAPGINPVGIYGVHTSDEDLIPATVNPKNWTYNSYAGDGPHNDAYISQILAMGKKGRMRPCAPHSEGLLALRVINKDGQDAIAPVYFTTIHRHANEDNVLGTQKWYKQILSKKWEENSDWHDIVMSETFPDVPEPMSLFYEEERFQGGFCLPVYGNRRNAWDILDVADIWGELKQPNPAIPQGSTVNYRDTFFSKRRLTRPSYFKKLGSKNGGFILEKYVKVKFKNPNQILATTPAGSNLAKMAQKLKENLLNQSATETSQEQTDLVIQNDILFTGTEDLEIGDEQFKKGTVIFEYEGSDSVSLREEIPGELKIYAGLGRETIPYGSMALEEHTLSYTAFIRLLREISGADIGDEYSKSKNGVLVGRQYRVSDIGGGSASDIDFPDSPRICIEGDVGFGEASEGDDGACGDVNVLWPGSPAAERESGKFLDLQEFVNWHSSMHPGDRYEIKPFSGEDTDYIFLGIGDTWKFKGYEIVRYKQDYSWIEDIANLDGDEKQVLDYLTSGNWKGILETFKVGLRISYVSSGDYLSEDMKTKMNSLLSPFLSSESNFDINGEPVPNTGYLDSLSVHNDIKERRLLGKWGHVLEQGDIVDNFGFDTDTKFDEVQEIYIMPLISKEMNPDDENFPAVLKGNDVSLMDLRTAYPSPEYMDASPWAKQTFDELYKRLRRDDRFKFLFEYALPSKRMLSINTLFNILAFEGTFRRECTFKQIFEATTSIALTAARLASDNPSGTYDYDVPDSDPSKDIQEAYDAQQPESTKTKCESNARIRSRFETDIE